MCWPRKSSGRYRMEHILLTRLHLYHLESLLLTFSQYNSVCASILFGVHFRKGLELFTSSYIKNVLIYILSIAFCLS